MLIRPNFLNAILTAVAIIMVACSAGAAEPTIPQGAGIDSWYQNGAGGRYVVEVIEGRIPVPGSKTQQAVVRTDTDCAPDAQGLNHCHNLISFNDGSSITIVDNHQMNRYRCLRPGESVQVTPLISGWAVIQVQM